MDQSADVGFCYADEEPWGKFSNLYLRSIVFEGREFPASEHAYQAGKPKRDSVREWLLAAPKPYLLAIVAHALPRWDVVSNWAEIREERMLNVLRAKFSQHEDLRELLLSTGSARLVETPRVNNAQNRRWGEVNGKGGNLLGKLLMQVRAELRPASYTQRV